MGKLVVRLGDTSSHGGTVVSSAAKTEAEGLLVARVTDLFSCPIHGVQTIIEGSGDTEVEGLAVARNGDRISCGGALISLASKSYVN